MDLVKKYAPIAAGLSIGQYCPPACFEIAGKRFEFVMDTGENAGDAVLNFLDETQLEWSIMGGDTLKTDKYECRKADDRTYLQRFELEAQAAASLVHANIVQIYEVGCVEGLHYIAQEYVQGRNLRDYVARHGPHEEEDDERYPEERGEGQETASTDVAEHDERQS